MRTLLPLSGPPLRHVILWIALGLLLATVFHGYWRLFCVVLVGVIAWFVVMQPKE